MTRILKVFCTGPEQDQLADSYRIIERYDGFLLLEAPEDQTQALAQRYPVEDITDLYTLQPGEEIIDTTQPRLDAKGKLRAHPAYKGRKRLAPGKHHYLVQFIGPIKENWLQEIEQAGGEPRIPSANFTYIVRADDSSCATIAGLSFVRWVGHLRHEDRIAPTVLAKAGRKPDETGSVLPRTRVLSNVYTVEFFDSRDLKEALNAIEDLGFQVLSQDPKTAVLVLQDSKGGTGASKRIKELAAIHGVRFIRERTLKRPSNDVAAGIMGTRLSWDGGDLGLSGQGEVIAVCDTGLDTGEPQTIHPDFVGRLAAILSYPISPDLASFINNPGGDDGPADLDSGHGTHVAGSVLGAGTASEELAGLEGPIRGLAYRAKLVFQAIEQEMQWKDPANFQRYGRYLLTGIPPDLTTLFADAYQRRARIHSNSWGGGDPGVYDDQCEQLDRFIWEHKDFCILFANGNDGTDRDGDGAINPTSVTSPATAKNCISVGACENRRPVFNNNTYGGWWPGDYPVAPFRDDPMANNPDQVVAFSSRGPTQDGRIKPEVVAPGTFILSTRSTMIAPNNMAWGAFPPSRLYFHMGGTSMATPLTAGAVALIREYLRTRQQIPNPSAALLKAALIAGAIRLPGISTAVADNDQGFGRVNLDTILAPVAPSQARFLEVTPGLRTGQIHTLELPVASGQVPLRVVLAYSDFPGSALVNDLNLILQAPDGTRHVGNQAPGSRLKLDAKNNTEVVQVSNPLPGRWSLQVVGSNIPRGPQDFALVILTHPGEADQANIIQAEATPDLPIPDNDAQGVTSVTTVTQPGSVGSVQIAVDIAHTYIGDLQVFLTAPDQTRVLLHDRSGASTNDLVRSYDVHTTPALAELTGSPAQGNWLLTVVDRARWDEGRLRRWQLTIQLADADPLRQENTPALTIPDNDPAGISDSITIAGTGILRNIKIWVDITHTWIGDLRVTLVAPSGKAVILHNRSGRSADNLIKTYDAGVLPALGDLTGESIQGTWTLKVADLAGQDVGKLNRWGLQIRL